MSQLLFLLSLTSFTLGLYCGKSLGIQEASKDNDLLQVKLAQCNEVLRGGK